MVWRCVLAIAAGSKRGRRLIVAQPAEGFRSYGREGGIESIKQGGWRKDGQQKLQGKVQTRGENLGIASCNTAFYQMKSISQPLGRRRNIIKHKHWKQGHPCRALLPSLSLCGAGLVQVGDTAGGGQKAGGEKKGRRRVSTQACPSNCPITSWWRGHSPPAPSCCCRCCRR